MPSASVLGDRGEESGIMDEIADYFSSAGDPVSAASGQALSDPSRSATDGSGNIYVVGSENGTVKRVSF